MARLTLLHQFSPLLAYWLSLARDLVIPKAPAHAPSRLIPAAPGREPAWPDYQEEDNRAREAPDHPTGTWPGRACKQG